MNYHQTPEDIIKAATPEQRILWNSIFLKYGDKIALQQLYFCGAIAGTEFLTYSANKMYMAMSVESSFVTSQVAITYCFNEFYNEANAVFYTEVNVAPAWDTTAAIMKFSNNNAKTTNILFSRIALTSYTRMKFIGYRLGI